METAVGVDEILAEQVGLAVFIIAVAVDSTVTILVAAAIYILAFVVHTD